MNVKRMNQALTMLIIYILTFGCTNNDKEFGQSNKPNVILIYADDLGYGDVTCYNPDSKISTPNIDKLADEGMRFTDAHSAASFCTPSRYSLLTGNYCWRSQNTSELQGGYGLPIIEDDEMTLGHLFRNNGYKTAALGKWHVGMKWTMKEGFRRKSRNKETVDHEKAT